MSSIRHKTLRRSHQDVSGDEFSFHDTVETLLNADANAAYRKPWHRLERGLRLNRLRAFSETLAAARSLKPAEQQALLTLLTKALDRKSLNSKTAVVYDPEKEEILEIKPLIMHQTAAGDVLFQITERRNNVTFRRRNSATGGLSPAD